MLASQYCTKIVACIQKWRKSYVQDSNVTSSDIIDKELVNLGTAAEFLLQSCEAVPDEQLTADVLNIFSTFLDEILSLFRYTTVNAKEASSMKGVLVVN
jgi:predicted alpha-1,6-mannanase (GH76 family)